MSSEIPGLCRARNCQLGPIGRGMGVPMVLARLFRRVSHRGVGTNIWHAFRRVAILGTARLITLRGSGPAGPPPWRSQVTRLR